MTTKSETVSVREAAERLGVSRDLLYRQIRLKQVPRVPGLGFRKLIPRRWLEDHLLTKGQA